MENVHEPDISATQMDNIVLDIDIKRQYVLFYRVSILAVH
jgi:hypothetical protein